MSKHIEICRNGKIIKYKGIIEDAQGLLEEKKMFDLLSFITWKSPCTFIVVDTDDCKHIFHTDEIKKGSVQIYEVLDD